MVRRAGSTLRCSASRAQPSVIRNVLKQAYVQWHNIDDDLVDLLFNHSRTVKAEAFRGFINLFDDYLAPQLMEELKVPVDLIWGERDRLEPLQEQDWASIKCIHSLHIVSNAGHCLTMNAQQSQRNLDQDN